MMFHRLCPFFVLLLLLCCFVSSLLARPIPLVDGVNPTKSAQLLTAVETYSPSNGYPESAIDTSIGLHKRSSSGTAGGGNIHTQRRLARMESQRQNRLAPPPYMPPLTDKDMFEKYRKKVAKHRKRKNQSTRHEMIDLGEIKEDKWRTRQAAAKHRYRIKLEEIIKHYQDRMDDEKSDAHVIAKAKRNKEYYEWKLNGGKDGDGSSSSSSQGGQQAAPSATPAQAEYNYASVPATPALDFSQYDAGNWRPYEENDEDQ